MVLANPSYLCKLTRTKRMPDSTCILTRTQARFPYSHSRKSSFSMGPYQDWPNFVFMYTSVLFGSSCRSGMEANVLPSMLGSSNTCVWRWALVISVWKSALVISVWKSALVISVWKSALVISVWKSALVISVWESALVISVWKSALVISVWKSALVISVWKSALVISVWKSALVISVWKSALVISVWKSALVIKNYISCSSGGRLTRAVPGLHFWSMMPSMQGSTNTCVRHGIGLPSEGEAECHIWGAMMCAYASNSRVQSVLADPADQNVERGL